MTRHGLWREIGMTALTGIGVCVLGGGFSTAGAAEKETRVFTIKIDGKQAGQYQMTITSQDEHTCTLDGRAEVGAVLFLQEIRVFLSRNRSVDGRTARSSGQQDQRRRQTLPGAGPG